VPDTPKAARTANRRGEGTKLREDILAAANGILESTGSDDAITLRAVARQVGVTAPAIYAHFSDRYEILRTVVENTFAELAATLGVVAERSGDPVQRLRALCHAYLDFAAEQPHHYRVLFERRRTTGVHVSGAAEPDIDVRTMVGADAFGVLLRATADCIDSGASTAMSAESTATRIWIGLHGQATLQASLPWFPWPDRDQLADDVMTRLADL
jgi:AcrR family transcriptional regulator